jgi:EAL domain-containing protein (putative c-di-GMP-specific phosphodiesterase class I)
MGFRSDIVTSLLSHHAEDALPEVVLRVHRDGTCFEVSVRGSDPPGAEPDLDRAIVESEIDELARTIGHRRKKSGPNLPVVLSPRPIESLLPPMGARVVKRVVATAFREAAASGGSYLVADEGTERSFSVRVVPNDADALVTIREHRRDDPANSIEEAVERGDLEFRYVARLDAQRGMHALLARPFAPGYEGADLLGVVSRVPGLRVQLDEWAVHEAVQHASWACMADLAVPFAVAVGHEWLLKSETVAIVRGLVACYGAGARRVEIGVRYEDWALAPEEIAAALDELRAIGCTTSIAGVARDSIEFGELDLLRADLWICDGVQVNRTGERHADARCEAFATIARGYGAVPVAAGITDARACAYLRDLGFVAFEGPFAGEAMDIQTALGRAAGAA